MKAINKIEDLKVEIAISKLYIKDLESLIKKCEKPVEKEKEKKKKKLESLKSEYANIDEAHEAYGYGEITEKEFEKLEDFFNNKQSVEEEKGAKELYLKFLKKTFSRENRELCNFENELEDIKNDSNS